MYFKKRGEKFEIVTPTAVIGIRGTLFDLTVEGRKTQITLLDGQVTAAAKKAPGDVTTLTAGNVCEVTESGCQVRPIAAPDVLDWYTEIQMIPESSDQHRFDRLFLTGMTTLRQGRATLADNGQEGALTTGQKIPIGGTVRTNDEERAEIRFACGSSLRLAPATELQVRDFGVALIRGAILVRHTRQNFPLKVIGPGTILVDSDSVGDVQASGDSLFVRVQKGTIRLTPGNQSFSAGETVRVSANEVQHQGVIMPAHNWPLQPQTSDAIVADELATAAGSLFEDAVVTDETQTTTTSDQDQSHDSDLKDILKP